jgi:hypothetical protein
LHTDLTDDINENITERGEEAGVVKKGGNLLMMINSYQGEGTYNCWDKKTESEDDGRRYCDYWDGETCNFEVKTGRPCKYSDNHISGRNTFIALSIKSCSGTFNAQNVGNCLYGMQGMSSDCFEVRALLSALLPKVEACKMALRAQEVGIGLYGMQGMEVGDCFYDNDGAEVRAILTAMVPKVDSCREALDAQAVGNALYDM